MSIAERVHSESEGSIIPEVDDEVLDVLLHWADDNNLDELEWREPLFEGSDGSWDGFPRDKELLVRLRELNLLGAKCEVLPKEIGHLTLLRDINLNQNSLSKLPKMIETKRVW